MIVSEELSGAVNVEFGRVVKKIIGDRSLRLLARQTGISHTRISDMAFGVVPSYRLLEKFTRSLGVLREDRDELFRAARYAPPEGGSSDALRLSDERGTYRMLPHEEEESGRRILLDGIAALNKELGRPIAISLDDSALAELTPEKARATLAFWRQQAEAGII